MTKETLSLCSNFNLSFEINADISEKDQFCNNAKWNVYDLPLEEIKKQIIQYWVGCQTK